MSVRKTYLKHATCPLCSTEIQTLAITAGYIAPSYTFDLRSVSIDYMNLHSELHCCNNCGYVFAENDKVPPNAKDTIKTEDYKTCDGIDFGDEITAQKYYKHALIQLGNDNFYGAFYAFLFGTWVCDDHNNKELSVMFRKKALEVFDILWEKCEIKEGFYLLRADILRRIGDFDTVIKDYSNFDSLNDDRVMIAKIQVMLAQKQDDSCHYFPDYSALLS